MRVVTINRRALGSAPLVFPTGESLEPSWLVGVFDKVRLPDGFPFVVDDDGTVTGCRHLNQYLLDAQAQSAFDLKSMRRFHVYNLARLLRFLRRSRAESRAHAEGQDVDEWWAANGEPKVDLTDATRGDLVAYRDSRKPHLDPGSLETEMGCISAFFRYAIAIGWMDSDPIPRWGSRQRNMLLPRARKQRVSKFLTAAQTRHFIQVGLRGDGEPPEHRPAFPERDYVYGLMLATMGLRREECAYLLDCEVPPPGQMPVSGVHQFDRTGKKDVTRVIYLTEEVAQAVHLYRMTERADIVQRAQRRLRRLRREGRLHLVEDLGTLRGEPAVVQDGHKVPVARLTDEERAIAAVVADDGTIQPLGLFLARGGQPPALAYWNELFIDARARVAERGDPDRPPAHINVTPHTMRHTFAVRMLAGLMREGVERVGNPYYLLANPVLTVLELLGHASLLTTQRYLFAAETWNEDVPAALRHIAANLVGHIEDEPGDVPETGEDEL